MAINESIGHLSVTGIIHTLEPDFDWIGTPATFNILVSEFDDLFSW